MSLINPRVDIAFKKIFGVYDDKFRAIENGARLLNANSSNHISEIYGGIEQIKCTSIL
jgi:hypothetical protein